jgi:hypothetical protein
MQAIATVVLFVAQSSPIVEASTLRTCPVAQPAGLFHGAKPIVTAVILP